MEADGRAAGVKGSPKKPVSPSRHKDQRAQHLAGPDELKGHCRASLTRRHPLHHLETLCKTLILLAGAEAAGRGEEGEEGEEREAGDSARTLSSPRIN